MTAANYTKNYIGRLNTVDTQLVETVLFLYLSGFEVEVGEGMVHAVPI